MRLDRDKANNDDTRDRVIAVIVSVLAFGVTVLLAGGLSGFRVFAMIVSALVGIFMLFLAVFGD